MSTQLIAHLKKKCEADDNIKILLSQWEFDQKLVGKALENIGGFYPHFSNHNASHSQQILVNIERILGKEIELLSGTDTWLILEAAYWHDAGMLVDAEKAKKVHNEDGFKKMLWDLKQNKSSDLHEFAKAFVDEGWQAAMALENHPFDGVEKYRQLIAEYFRKEHSERIGNIVLEDYKNLGINTPRTELLPNRLFRYLGSICVGHGMNFDKMMSVLPQCQTGLGTEDCHPLFVACLLRLGDLFDLDDNRFCPVMAKHVSKKPSLSQHHENKHLSLREFQLDRRTVKLVAECPDEMSYIETQNWFGWIREEFQNQMSQWNLIVPNQKFGSLPTIEQLDVRMQVKYENGVKKEKILLDNKPMRFSLDESKSIEILQGANLYRDVFSVFRELIQNSIDATLIRVWRENKNIKFSLLNPLILKADPIMDDYQIDIIINVIDVEQSIYGLVIRDRGTGISIDDLKYMQKISGSYRNIKKKKIISEMPAWMRPSGEFGIGLHSSFLLIKDLPVDYHKINIKTKSISSNECLELEMHSPLGDKEGYTFISKVDGESFDFGTEISVKFKFNESVLKIWREYNLRENYPIEDLPYFGFLTEKYIGEYIIENISRNSIVKFNTQRGKNSDINKMLEKEYSKSDYIWIDSLCLRIKLSKSIADSRRGRLMLFYKGQFVKTHFTAGCFDYFDIEIDIYGLDAKDVLLMNRDEINEKFRKKLKYIFVDIKNFLEKNIEIFENYFEVKSEFFILKYELGIFDFSDNTDVEGIGSHFIDYEGNFQLSCLVNKNLICDSSSFNYGDYPFKTSSECKIYYYSSRKIIIVRLILEFSRFLNISIYKLLSDKYGVDSYLICSDLEGSNIKEELSYFDDLIIQKFEDQPKDLNFNDFLIKFSNPSSYIRGRGEIKYINLISDIYEFSRLAVNDRIIFPFYKIDNDIFEIDTENLVEYYMTEYGNQKDIKNEECRSLFVGFKEKILEKAELIDNWNKHLKVKQKNPHHA